MTQDQVIELAKQAGLRSPLILHAYNGNVGALCDSEIEELESIQRFAELLRDVILGEVVQACEKYIIEVGSSSDTTLYTHQYANA